LALIVCIFLTLSVVSAADNSSTVSSSSSVMNSTNGVNINSGEITSDDGSNSDIYVSPSGDDSNTGKSNTSALKTINASISKVNESDNAIIHLGEGTFAGNGNNMINIKLAHNNYNGSITFIGAGYNKTFIDGEGQYKLFTISADSRVNFINLTFINSKDNLGGVMTNDGIVNIDNCIFENNTAVSGGSVFYTEELSTTTVKNSLFVNNNASGDGGVAYMSGNASFINSKFINSSAVKVSSWGYSNTEGGVFNFYQGINFDLISCEFYNNTAYSAGVAYILGTSKNNGNVSVFNIKNNKFVNCTAISTDDTSDVLFILNARTFNLTNNTVIEPGKNAPFYIYPGSITENLNLVFMNNSTVDVNSPRFNLYATVTDDMGNKISGGKVYFYINGTNVGNTNLNNGIASIKVTNLLDNGIYTISGYYENGANTTNNKAGAINFYVNREIIELYVSPNGNDETGDGSKDNPFKSLKKAINVGFENHVNVVINLAEGNYPAENNSGLSLGNIGFLKIIGNGYNKTVIDFNNTNVKCIDFGTYVSADLINMTFINTNGYCISNPYAENNFVNLNDCIFENDPYALNIINGKVINCTFIKSSGIVRNITINNSRFINLPNALDLRTSNVYNSLFENNTNGAISASQGIPLYTGISYIIDNCTFINNSAKNGGAISFPTSSMSSGDRIGIINNCIFINNTATDYGGALAVDPSMNITVSNNKFIDNKGKYGGAIVIGTDHAGFSNGGNITLRNNTMTNNEASVEANEIYCLNSHINGYLQFNDLTTTKLSDNLSAIVTDDMGNKISGGSVLYYLDGNYVGKSALINGSSSLIYVGFSNGTYSLNGDYSNNINRSNNKKATVIVNIKSIDRRINLYVSTDGSDEKGDGSASSPYKTIQHAYEVGITKSNNIYITLFRGTYFGLGNVNLNISGNVNVTIKGQGSGIILDETPLDNIAQPSITVTPGNQTFTLSNLVFKNGVTKYNQQNRSNIAENIIIPNGVTARFENVNFTSNHGNTGGVVSNYGDLTVINCVFFNNGDSYNASTIFNNNTLKVINSNFTLNHGALSTITNNGNMTILSSRFEDDLRSGYMSFFYRIKNTGYAEVNNTVFIITGKNQTEILDIIGNDTMQYGSRNAADRDNPLCSNELYNSGTIIYANDRFEDHPANVKYNGAKSGWNKNSVWGSNGIILSLDGNNTVINSTFVNIQNLHISSPNTVLIDGCLFENLSKLSVSLSKTGISADYLNNISIVNSVILFNESVSDPFIVYTAGVNNYTLNFNNNWFGSNTQPSYIKSENGYSTKSNINIDKWLVLTLDNITNENLGQKFTIGFKVSDGENLTDYTGNLPVRTFKFETDDGTINPVNGSITNSKNIEFNSKTTGNKTINLTVDKEVLVYNTSVYKKSVLNISSLVILGNTTALITLTDLEGNPISGDVVVLVNGVEYQVTIKDGKVEFTPDEFTKTGKYDVVVNYAGSTEYLPSNIETNVSVLKISKTTIDVDDNGNIIVKLTDAEGNPISNASVKSLINDTNSNTFITDDNGIVNITSLTGKLRFTAIFNGNDEFLGSNESDNLLIIPKTRTTTTIVSSDFSQTAVDFYHGERGGYFTVVLKDFYGNVLVNKPVSVGFNGVVYNLVTDGAGVAKLQINLAWSGIYTFAVAFLGDDDYNGSFVVNKITISPKVSSISVSGVNPVKVNVYRTLTFALKGVSALDSRKSVNAVGRVLTVVVNGRTYNLKTDKNGRASLRLRFSRAGVYTITTRFVGDGTFAAKSMTSRITVRR